MLHHPRYYGIDSEIVQQAIAQARRDRTQAVIALIKRLFGRGADAASSVRPAAEPRPATSAY